MRASPSSGKDRPRGPRLHPVRIVINTGRCLGNARCVAAAPEVFDVDDDGIVFLLDDDPPAELAAKVELAVQSCPTGALSLAD
jgi:ferredoxin